MKALEKIDNILTICKSMFYTAPIIDVSKLIFPLLQKKFNFKAQENIWILKKHLFDIFHKMTFRKDFECLPFMTFSDLLSFNPFQRFFCCNYIDLFPNLCKKYIDVKKDEGYQKNHIDELLRILDKYRTIRNKGEYAYEHCDSGRLCRQPRRPGLELAESVRRPDRVRPHAGSVRR